MVKNPVKVSKNVHGKWIHSGRYETNTFWKFSQNFSCFLIHSTSCADTIFLVTKNPNNVTFLGITVLLLLDTVFAFSLQTMPRLVRKMVTVSVVLCFKYWRVWVDYAHQDWETLVEPHTLAPFLWAWERPFSIYISRKITVPPQHFKFAVETVGWLSWC